MTEYKLDCEYKLDRYGKIKNLGKYKGEYLWCPYFHSIAHTGEIISRFDENYKGRFISLIKVTPEHVEKFSGLHRAILVAITETENGSVYGEALYSDDEIAEFRKYPW